jgi:hypothetical protein
MPAVTASFDHEGLRSAISRLAKISGADMSTVVRGEAMKVLESASAKTVKADRAKIEKTRDPKLRKKRLAAIGLARRAFYELARDAGLGGKYPAYVRNAKSPLQDRGTSGKVTVRGKKSEFIGRIAGFRSYPGAAMYRALNSAMWSRANSFRMAMRKGFLDNAQGIARRYPWLKVK